MNKFEKWILRLIAQRLIAQDQRADYITEMHDVVNGVARAAFHEDNVYTFKIFMHERFMASLNKVD